MTIYFGRDADKRPCEGEEAHLTHSRLSPPESHHCNGFTTLGEAAFTVLFDVHAKMNSMNEGE
jgi:hypothetical protein